MHAPGFDPGDRGALGRGAFFSALAFLASNLRGIFTFLVARLLGSAVLGTFGVAWAATDLVSKFSTLGFETTAVTYVARAEGSGDPERAAWVSRTMLRIGVVLSVATAAAGFVLLWPLGFRFGLSPDVARALGVTLLALPGIALYRISNSASRGMAEMHHDIFSRGFTESVATTAALLVAILAGARTLAPEIAAVFGTLASGLVAFSFARRLFRGRRPTPMPLAPLLIDSSAIAVYDFFNIAIMQIDLIMLGLFVGRAPGVTMAAVGVYAGAVEMASGLRKMNQAFSPVLTSAVARQMAVGDVRAAETTFGTIGRWMLTLLLPATFAMMLASRALMAIYGPAFTIGAPWLAILALACATNAFAGLAETILTVERPRLNLTNAVIAFAVAVGLNLVLIPRFGPLGAAIGMLVPYLLYGVLRTVEISWLFRWRWPWRALMKPIVAAVLPAGPAAVLAWTGDSIVRALLSALVFLGGYLLMWRVIGFDAGDREMVATLFGRNVRPTRRFSA